ncbi:HAD family acid phosphatase [Sphingomonas sp.]|uniref:HAD family acid phosphatase n=1 Tax=Sphingomonas sp. TaxID=28214 RepID=UPI001EBA2593|nr:HAD family acid phosphatase [Sphingomonas sp.]MBX3595537.1 acid phosphatase [Sphingomonas sp.]
MKRVRAAIALALLPVMAGGCIAAAIPIAASGVIAREKLKGRGEAPVSRKARKPRKAKAEARVTTPTPASGPGASPVAPPPRATMPEVTGMTVTTLKELPRPDGEAAASSLQGYQALWNYLSAKAAARSKGSALRSVVLGPSATLAAPAFEPCGSKPLAVLFDLDENDESAGDPDARFRRWRGDGSDLVVAVPGAVDGVQAARREGVTPIFTSARAASGAPGVVALLERLGFGTAEPGRTLILRGGADEVQSAEATRRAVASRYCVIAIVGDSLSEFSGLFDGADSSARRGTAATETMVAPLWGAGWFLLPNPIRSIARPDAAPPKE